MSHGVGWMVVLWMVTLVSRRMQLFFLNEIKLFPPRVTTDQPAPQLPVLPKLPSFFPHHGHPFQINVHQEYHIRSPTK